MTKHDDIIKSLLPEYRNDPNCLALLVTGSVARNEAGDNSDIDLLQISTSEQPFKEFTVDGILVEVKINTKSGFIEKMKTKPMNVYQWIDAKVIFGDKNISQEIISTAESIYDNYKSDPDEIKAIKKWLESTKTKINEAIKRDDSSLVGFNISNILWKIVEGIYLLNDKPLPPSTTAFRRIGALGALPNDFSTRWKKVLVDSLETRTRSTLYLIDFLISRL